jgi:hypothetical protein
MMRLRGDIDQKALGELFYQYLNVEEDFIRELFVRGETQLGRVFVHEPILSAENTLHVLDPDSHLPGDRCLLLPSQDAARWPQLRCSDGDLHDL